jgi:putative transposase
VDARADIFGLGSGPSRGRRKRRSRHDPVCRQWRAEVVGIFPNDEAIVRLVGAILLEQNGEWAVQRARYMTLETMAALSDDPVVGLPAMVI